jgi:hypothetical protein
LEVFLAEHPHHPIQLFFVPVLGVDRVAQPASGCFVHSVLNGLIHRSPANWHGNPRAAAGPWTPVSCESSAKREREPRPQLCQTTFERPCSNRDAVFVGGSRLKRRPPIARIELLGHGARLLELLDDPEALVLLDDALDLRENVVVARGDGEPGAVLA